MIDFQFAQTTAFVVHWTEPPGPVIPIRIVLLFGAEPVTVTGNLLK